MMKNEKITFIFGSFIKNFSKKNVKNYLQNKKNMIL